MRGECVWDGGEVSGECGSGVCGREHGGEVSGVECVGERGGCGSGVCGKEHGGRARV